MGACLDRTHRFRRRVRFFRLRNERSRRPEDVCAALKAYAAQDFRGLRRVCRRRPMATRSIRKRCLLVREGGELGGFDFGPALDMEDKLAALGFRRGASLRAIGGNAIVSIVGIIDLSKLDDGVMLSLPAVGFTVRRLSRRKDA
ncbi:MAG: hypothetical protein ACLT98_08310 [Eggerthellaceae bacterium]